MTYRPNLGFKADWERAQSTRAFLQRQADGMAADIKRVIRSEAYATGTFYNSIRGEVQDVDGDLAAVVLTDDEEGKVLSIEFGGIHNRTVAPLRRGAEGYRVR